MIQHVLQGFNIVFWHLTLGILRMVSMTKSKQHIGKLPETQIAHKLQSIRNT